MWILVTIATVAVLVMTEISAASTSTESNYFTHCNKIGSPYALNASVYNTTTLRPYKFNFSIPKDQRECIFIIEAPQGYNVNLEIQYFQQDHCPYKHLEIYDGNSAKSDVILSSCSDWLYRSLYPLFSSDQYLYVHFTNSYFDLNFGGLAYLKFMATRPGSTCSLQNTPDINNNIITTGSSGELKVPWPRSAKLIYCGWRISVPDGYFVQLNIPNLKGNKTDDYKCLRFEAYDNKFGVSPKIFRTNCAYDREELPTVLYSTGRYLTIRYSALFDPNKSTGPLLASFTSVKQSVKGACGPGKPSVIEISGEFGAFSTNDISRFKDYNDSIDCTWLVTVPQGSHIKVSLQSLSFRSFTGDIVEVRDGSKGESKLLRKSCSTSMQGWPVYSSGRHVRIRVTRAANRKHSFFYGNYQAVSTVPNTNTEGICSVSNTHEINNNIVMTGNSGTFQGPSGSAVTCTWKITAPVGRIVKLSLKQYRFQCSASESLVVRLPNNGKTIWTSECSNTVSSKAQKVTTSRRSVWVHYDAGCETISGGKFVMQYDYELSVESKIGIAVAVILFVVLVMVAWHVIRRRTKKQQQSIGEPLHDVGEKEALPVAT